MSNNFLSNEKLNTFNQKSLQSFNELKMPTKKDRPWRYTDVKHLDLETFDLSNSDCKVNIENDSQSGVNIDSFKIDKIKNEIKLFSEYIGTTNAMNVVRALEFGLLRLKDPLMIAKQRGITVKELFSKV